MNRLHWRDRRRCRRLHVARCAILNRNSSNVFGVFGEQWRNVARLMCHVLLTNVGCGVGVGSQRTKHSTKSRNIERKTSTSQIKNCRKFYFCCFVFVVLFLLFCYCYFVIVILFLLFCFCCFVLFFVILFFVLLIYLFFMFIFEKNNRIKMNNILSK